MLKPVLGKQILIPSRSRQKRHPQTVNLEKESKAENLSFPKRTQITAKEAFFDIPIISKGVKWFLGSIAKLPIISEIVESKAEKLQKQIDTYKNWQSQIPIVPRSSIGEIVKAPPFPPGTIGLFFDIEGSTTHVADNRIEEILNLSLQAHAIILKATNSLGLPIRHFPLEVATDGIMLVLPANVLALAREELIKLFNSSKFNVLGGFRDLEGQSALMAIEKESKQPQYFGMINKEGKLERTLHKAEGLAKQDKTSIIHALENEYLPFFNEYINSSTGGSLSDLKAYNAFQRFLERKIPNPIRLQNPEPLRVERTVLSLRKPTIVSPDSDSSKDRISVGDKYYSQRPEFEPDFLKRFIKEQRDPVTGEFLNLKNAQDQEVFYSTLWASDSKPSAYAFLVPTRDGSPITPKDLQLVYEIIKEVSCGKDMFPNASLLDNPININQHNLKEEVFDSVKAGFDGNRVKVCEGMSFILTAPEEVVKMFCTKLAEKAPHLLISLPRGRDSISLTTYFDKEGNPIYTCTDTVDAEGGHPLRWSGYITAATIQKIKQIRNILIGLSNKLPTNVLENLIPAYNYDKNPAEKLLIGNFKSNLKEAPKWESLMANLEKANPQFEKELKRFYKLFNLECLLKTEYSNSFANQSPTEMAKQRELAIKLREMDLMGKEYDDLINPEPSTKLNSNNLGINPETWKKAQERYKEFSDYPKLFGLNADTVVSMQDFLNWSEIELGSIQRVTNAIINNFRSDLSQHLIPEELKIKAAEKLKTDLNQNLTPEELKTKRERLKYQLNCLPVLLRKKVLDFCESTKFNLRNKDLVDILKHLNPLYPQPPAIPNTTPASTIQSNENLISQLRRVQRQNPYNDKTEKNIIEEPSSSFRAKNDEGLISELREAQARKLYDEIIKNRIEEPLEIKVEDYKEHLKAKIKWLKKEMEDRKNDREANQAKSPQLESSLLTNGLEKTKLRLSLIQTIAGDEDKGNLHYKIKWLEEKYKRSKQLIEGGKCNNEQIALLTESMGATAQKIKNAEESIKTIKKITRNLDKNLAEESIKTLKEITVNDLTMIDFLEKLEIAANQESLALTQLTDNILSEMRESLTGQM